MEEPVAAALARPGEQWPFCVVVDETGVVLGLLRADAEGETVEEAMEPGPATIRASQPLDPLLEALAGEAEPLVLVTDPDGRLLGIVDARTR